MLKESETKFAVKNTTHGCGFFNSREEALGQIKRCQGIPEKLRFFKVGKGCQVCMGDDLPDVKDFEESDIAKYPFGTLDGLIDHSIRVIFLPDVK